MRYDTVLAIASVAILFWILASIGMFLLLLIVYGSYAQAFLLLVLYAGPGFAGLAAILYSMARKSKGLGDFGIAWIALAIGVGYLAFIHAQWLLGTEDYSIAGVIPVLPLTVVPVLALKARPLQAQPHSSSL